MSVPKLDEEGRVWVRFIGYLYSCDPQNSESTSCPELSPGSLLLNQWYSHQAKNGFMLGYHLEIPCGHAFYHSIWGGLFSNFICDSWGDCIWVLPSPTPKVWLWWQQWWQVRWYHYNYPSNFRRKNCKVIVTRLQIFLIIHESANQNVTGLGKMTNET